MDKILQIIPAPSGIALNAKFGTRDPVEGYLGEDDELYYSPVVCLALVETEQEERHVEPIVVMEDLDNRSWPSQSFLDIASNCHPSRDYFGVEEAIKDD